MYVNGSRRGHDRDGAQRVSGAFLALFQRGDEIRGVVRSVKMHQTGHFMMGAMRLGPASVSLSGTYGGDGLAEDGDALPDAIWGSLLPFDDATRHAWKTSTGGHNGAGSEGPAVHEWASLNEVALRRAGRLARGVKWTIAEIPIALNHRPDWRQGVVVDANGAIVAGVDRYETGRVWYWRGKASADAIGVYRAVQTDPEVLGKVVAGARIRLDGAELRIVGVGTCAFYVEPYESIAWARLPDVQFPEGGE